MVYSMCEYWTAPAAYNHGGHRPCGRCDACIQEVLKYERLVRFNEATARGANPNR